MLNQGLDEDIPLYTLPSQQRTPLVSPSPSRSPLHESKFEIEEDIILPQDSDTAQMDRATPVSVFLIVYFIVIAAVLGTGILGLPAKLAHTGFTPFIASYSLCFAMQLLALYFFVELLQRAHVIRNTDIMAAATLGTGDDTEGGDLDVAAPLASKQGMLGSLHSSAAGPDLHYMGEKFLGKHARRVFDLAVILHMISVLVSYGLAGSEAYGHLIGIPYRYLILPFIATLTLVVVFLYSRLAPVISIFTFVKGAMLVIIVFVTGVVAAKVKNPISSDWAYIGRPFLIGTVALAGSSNVLPIVFPRVESTKREMIKLMITITAALTTVYLLNALWCFYLLRIIPQLPPPDHPNSPSLLVADQQGLIATVPLIDIIRASYPAYNWIASLVNVFIVLSITVSYITMGSGFKHILVGIAASWRTFAHQSTQQDTGSSHAATSGRFAFIGIVWGKIRQAAGTVNSAINDRERRQFQQGRTPLVGWREGIAYFLGFGMVLTIALTNPKGFLNVLEFSASLGTNLQTGVFIVIMVQVARAQQRGRIIIAYPLPDLIYSTRFVVICYFAVAVFYDLLSVFTRLFITP